MRRLLALLLLLWVLAPTDAHAQASVALWCFNPTGSSATNNQYVPCSSTNPLAVAATITPSGTQDVNLKQVGGSAISIGQAAMAASLPVAIASNQSTLTVTGAGGTFPVTQSTSPWVVSNGGTFAVQSAGAVNVTPTDCSGAISSGGTAQNAFTAAATRHGFIIANIDTSEVLWFSTTTTAVASGTGSFPLAPATATSFAGLSSFTSPTGFGINTALSVIAATTSHKFTCTVY